MLDTRTAACDTWQEDGTISRGFRGFGMLYMLARRKLTLEDELTQQCGKFLEQSLTPPPPLPGLAMPHVNLLPGRFDAISTHCTSLLSRPACWICYPKLTDRRLGESGVFKHSKNTANALAPVLLYCVPTYLKLRIESQTSESGITLILWTISSQPAKNALSRRQ